MSDFKIVKLLDPIVLNVSGPRFTGEYLVGTTYIIGDSVDYNGSSYAAYAVTTGNLPTDTSFWQLLAAKGDTGAAGSDGVSITATNLTFVLSGETKTIAENYENVVTSIRVDGMLIINGLLTFL